VRVRAVDGISEIIYAGSMEAWKIFLTQAREREQAWPVEEMPMVLTVTAPRGTTGRRRRVKQPCTYMLEFSFGSSVAAP
jgi:hypothetical protein